MLKSYTAKEISEILKSEGDEEMTIRKVRYYNQIGILPPMMKLKNKNYFNDEHLNYLRAMRTMQKTGEKLEDIKGKLKGLDVKGLENIGKQMSYISSERLLKTETCYLNDDVSITFSGKIEGDKREKIINKIKELL